MVQSSTKKSTIDRTIVHHVSTTAFALADALAPRLAAAWAYRLWFELPPPARTGTTDPDGIVELLGSPFEATLRGRVVRGWTYGEGPVVYLVHGWSGHAEQLRPLVRHLLAHGLKVVAFDGLSHGRSDAGVHGSGSSDAVELGRSLDAVAARFGPARAVVAHSMGALSALLALRDGWLATERLILIAPVEGVPDFLARFRARLRFGPRTERLLIARAEQRTGYPVADLDVARLGEQLESRPELLVIHDLGDRETPHEPSARLVAGWPGAELYSTVGLGHRRILADAAVGGTVARFAARLPVEPLLHAGDVPPPMPRFEPRQSSVA
ncbi:MAG TPA: alpha/beta fold hydrolase [Intrasporangium sp.]|uniref:alpha/beta hydrolase n=1 Tax=Intrasporangium sp. TaxID=1925024 RepID=UPI002B45ED07|nr:alpha/beta fold hydrolase [Intrasporangium sp.]HKX68682.1 alpha/beta fold hydrolase [Intrasporangium sp.]